MIHFAWSTFCSLCVKGAKVMLLIKELELTSRFLGEKDELTLSEADCKIVGVIESPVKQDRASISTER